MADELTVEEQAVVAAKERLAEAEKILAEAKTDHEEAVAAHRAVIEAAQPKAEFGKHILVDFGGTGDYVVEDVPRGDDAHLLPRHLIRGQNVEHVDEDPVTGVWRYRAM